MTSRHYQTERREREQLIRQIGEGSVIAEFVIDKGHEKGKEIHKITTTALILVYNQKTGKLITKLIARPNQITRYNWNAPEAIVKLAREHQKQGMNKR